MFIRAKEQRIARSYDAEVAQSPDNQGVVGLWGERDEELIDVVCLDCGARFSAENPDECEICGSSDLDVD